MVKLLNRFDILIILLILLLSFIACWPLLKPGFFETHDGLAHLINIVEFDKMVKAGQFPVRWAADLDYGYGNPIFTFFSPLLYYLTKIFILGLGYLNSLKTTIFLATFTSGVFTFLLVKEFWGRWGGFISATAYIFTPYHFFDLYVRGAFPEFLAISLLPVVLWCFFKLLTNGGFLYFISASFSILLVLMAHNYISFIFFPVLALFLLILIFSFRPPFKKIIKVFMAVILGLGLSAFLMVPVIFERQYLLSFATMNIFQPEIHFLDLPSLWDCQFTYKVDPGERMCFQLGKIHLLLGLAPILIFGQMDKKKRFFFGFLYFTLVAALFFSLPVSAFFWKNVTLISYGQFPWRFLTISTLALSLSSGAATLFFKEKKGKIIFSLMCVILLTIFNLDFSKGLSFNDISDLKLKRPGVLENVFIGPSNLKEALYFRETIPRWIKKAPQKVPDKKIEIKDGRVENLKIQPINYSFSVNALRRTKVKVNTFYFPGWKVLVDKKETQIEIGEDGTINFSVLKGEHKVKVVFTKTKPREIGEIISLVSLLTTLALGVIFSLARPGLANGVSKPQNINDN